MKPVISYPGAKWRFYKYIKPYIPRDIKDWREPFFGGGSMSLSIAEDPDFKLERMLVGDLAPEIWAFWTGCRDYADSTISIAMEWFKKNCPIQIQMQDIPEDSADYLELYDKAIEEGKKFWDFMQAVDCSKLSIPERAARLFLTHRISFSGMGDSGSMSKDAFMKFRMEKLDRIKEAEKVLQRIEIRNVSFEETMANVDPDKTFIFLDPPYYRQEKSGLYGRGGDTHRGFPHELFADVTKRTNCKWFITYDDSIKVRKMFKGKTTYGGKCRLIPFVLPGGYTLAGKTAEDALDGEELFIMNYDIEEEDIEL